MGQLYPPRIASHDTSGAPRRRGRDKTHFGIVQVRLASTRAGIDVLRLDVPVTFSASPSRPHPPLSVDGIVLAALGSVAFSGKAIIVKLGYRYGADATTLIMLRMLFALPLFAATAVWIRTRRDLSPLLAGDAPKILVLGFLGYYLASFLDFVGLRFVTATLERLIIYLNPTLVLAIGAVILKRPVTGRQVIALCISYLGVVLTFAHDLALGGSSIVVGSAFVFASTAAYAVYLVGSGELVRRVGSIRLTAYASCVACVLCILQFAITRPLSALDLPAPVYWLSLLNALACTVLPVFAVMMAIARIGAAATAQIGMIGPIATIVLSAIVLHEEMGPWQISGTALVLTGVFVISHRTKTGD